MNQTITKHIKELQKYIEVLKSLEDFDSVKFISNCIYFKDMAYKENLLIVKKIEERLKTDLFLDTYFECYGRLALKYMSEDEIEFVLFCTDMEETLELFGCEIRESTTTTTEKEVVCVLSV